MKRACVAVAWSGGRDSTALLHATLHAAKPLGLEVVALHVHHGLSDFADAWLSHCERQCERWQRKGLPLQLHFQRLVTRPAPGQSVEAWARQARYEALRRMALEQGAELVLLAHHRRDQAETLLLQALRGAGVAGLAGMPAHIEREGVTWMRPWLQVPKGDVDAYVRTHRLAHIDDDSNSDPRFARNRLRLQVWPSLTQAFPEAEATLADAAGWAHEADACLGELAQLDLDSVANSQGLKIGPWKKLSGPRRSNVLRHWLRKQLGRPPESSLVVRLLDELAPPGPHRWPCAEGELRHYRGQLSFHKQFRPAGQTSQPEPHLSIKRAGRYRLPGWGGELQVKRVSQGGVPLAWLAQLELRPRSGGERFQAGPGRPPRSLKKQFQAAGIPAWARAAPLVFSGGHLVYVPGLGLDARAIGLPGQAQVSLAWVNSASAG